MPDHKSPPNLALDGLDQELLDELQNQTLDNLCVLRKHQRVEIRVPLVLAPGNSSSREPAIEGHTIDVSSGGCLGIFTRPVLVGDIYRVQIEDPRLDVPAVYARCLRCRLTREDAFEAAFTFFSQLSFGAAPAVQDNDLLG